MGDTKNGASGEAGETAKQPPSAGIIDVAPDRKVSVALKVVVAFILAVIAVVGAVGGAYSIGVGRSMAQEAAIQKAVKDAQDAATAAADARKDVKETESKRVAEEKDLRALIAAHDTAIRVLEEQQKTTNTSVAETKATLIRMDERLERALRPR